jgi:hypothetical protein
VGGAAAIAIAAMTIFKGLLDRETWIISFHVLLFYGLYFWFLTTLKASQERVRASRAFTLDMIIINKHEYLINRFLQLSQISYDGQFAVCDVQTRISVLHEDPLNAPKPYGWLSLAPC